MVKEKWQKRIFVVKFVVKVKEGETNYGKAWGKYQEKNGRTLGRAL